MSKRLIYEEDAIDELVRWGKIPDYSDKEKILIGAVIGMLSALPSAQPEDIARDIATIIENENDMRVMLQHRWIPCSERLPNKDGYYLVSVVDNQSVRTEKCSYDELDADRPFCPTEALAGRKNLTHGYPKEMTIAWMPLPDPWKDMRGDENG